MLFPVRVALDLAVAYVRLAEEAQVRRERRIDVHEVDCAFVRGQERRHRAEVVTVDEYVLARGIAVPFGGDERDAGGLGRVTVVVFSRPYELNPAFLHVESVARG